MEERNHTSAPETAKKCCCCGWGAFLVGLVVALILGWAVLPALMQKELKQPIAFNHVLHVDEQGIDCAQCHFTGPDGQFSGVPTTATCGNSDTIMSLAPAADVMNEAFFIIIALLRIPPQAAAWSLALQIDKRIRRLPHKLTSEFVACLTN